MATLLLSSAASNIGASMGGSLLGFSSAEIGQTLFTQIGSVIDSQLLGGFSVSVETGRINNYQISETQEGTPIPRIFGRLRTAGHLIWSTNFLEKSITSETNGGGKGNHSPSQRSVKYSYSVSVAFALCEGVMQRIDRIWADGQEISPSDLNMRFYDGSETQNPDAKIEAIEGANNAPSFRGVAYVVIEDFELEPYGNRIPRMEFEVVRQTKFENVKQQHNMTHGTKAVALIPGAGEYVLASEILYTSQSLADIKAINEHTHARKADFQVAIQSLGEELKNCKAVSLVVSWFGDDLRAGLCRIHPKVEHSSLDSTTMPWRVSGLQRKTAKPLPTHKGRPIYGGTPTDQSVIQAIKHLKQKGYKVMYYPFLLMDIVEGNTKPDPWSDASSQPALPWRGYITSNKASSQSGTNDKTPRANEDVRKFFGQCKPENFTIGPDKNTVEYSGVNEWSYRRFILHNAKLCAAAGGVDTFCIGSEMRGLTQIRSARNVFPTVEELRHLANDVRKILGQNVKITYAADWTEYFGYHPDDGSNDMFFHLDPLWADENIDCVGIDNYMPLSDWRDHETHKDAQWGSIYNISYLMSNIEGGEGYDWHYANAQARKDQTRTAIIDTAYGEDWVFRYKDIKGWWSNTHYNRIGGSKESKPTSWIARSKPIWFTEIGCAALDKATNQPNKFLDPLSSDSSLPYYSRGTQDQLIQQCYFAALYSYWNDAEKNPSSNIYEGSMIDMDNAYVWNWDVRPYPAFPNFLSVWSDGVKYKLGHWIVGRTSQQNLGAVIQEICAQSGLFDVNVNKVFGQIHGYRISSVETARASLQPLMLAYGVDAFEHNGTIIFKSRSSEITCVLNEASLAVSSNGTGSLQMVRIPEAETVGRVRLRYLEMGKNYSARISETALSDDPILTVSQSEFDLILDEGEADDITWRWLIEARIARDIITLTVSLSQIGLSVGDVVRVDLDTEKGNYRINAITVTDRLEISAQRVEKQVYNISTVAGKIQELPQILPPSPGFVLFLDLPLLKGNEIPHQPYIAVTKDKWTGAMQCYSSPDDSDFTVVATVTAPAKIGKILDDIKFARAHMLWRERAIKVEMAYGYLSSVDFEKMLNGANLAAIGSGSNGVWEIIQFQNAVLIEPNIYELSGILRGQAGTDAIMPDKWPKDSYIVIINTALMQLDLASATRGLMRNYRTGPSVLSYDHAAYRKDSLQFEGVGLRPFAPCHLRAVKNGQGAIILSWIRRTRIDGDSWQSYDVPLGEERERYLVSVYLKEKLVRQKEVAKTEFTYFADEQAEDGVEQSIELRVAQISEQFGLGLEIGVIFDG